MLHDEQEGRFCKIDMINLMALNPKQKIEGQYGKQEQNNKNEKKIE